MSPYRESTEEQGSIQRGQDALSCRTREGEPARQGRRLGSKSKERERGGASGVRDGVAQDCLRPDIRLETRDFLKDFFRYVSRIERHHAPPQFLLRGSAGPLAGAQKRFLVRSRGALAS